MKEKIINSVEKLDTEDKNKVLELAKYSQLDKAKVQHRLSHVASLLRDKALESDMLSHEGVADFKEVAINLLTKVLPHWSNERINEEIRYFRGHSRLNYDRIFSELYIINMHYKNN